jgi:hypothetical protein
MSPQSKKIYSPAFVRIKNALLSNTGLHLTCLWVIVSGPLLVVLIFVALWFYAIAGR